MGEGFVIDVVAIAAGNGVAILGAVLYLERRITRIERDVKWLVRERELDSQHQRPMEH